LASRVRVASSKVVYPRRRPTLATQQRKWANADRVRELRLASHPKVVHRSAQRETGRPD
jgi:hypothetical protein